MIPYEPTNMSVQCSGAEMWLIHVSSGCKAVARVFWVVDMVLLGYSGWLLGLC